MSARSINRFFSLLVLVALLLQPLAVTGKQVDEETRKQGVAAPVPETGLYRTTVTVDSPARRARLEALGVVVLADAPGQAVVLADADQLEALARLRFEPRASDDVDALVATHAAGAVIGEAGGGASSPSAWRRANLKEPDTVSQPQRG